ncbi:MAG: hypothetical protein IT445_03790 [Phycisphaeraceae bacterium]|nr:hypothetical protein [Phycisphaeraceae bacterium]
MSEHPHHHKSDDELLADAIPIPPEAMDDDGEPGEEALRPIELSQDLESGEGDPQAAGMIRTFGSSRREASRWKRKPQKSSHGASHMKTFVAKLRLDAIDHMDNQINEWLDEHPDYDIKFVTASVGTLVGKTTEEALFLNVWV